MFNCKRILFFVLFIIFITAIALGEGVENWFHWRAGLEALDRGNFKHAQEEFEYYLRNPNLHRHFFGIAYFGKGLVFDKLKQYDNAIDMYNLAIQNDIHPMVMIKDKAYMNIGAIHMRNKDYQGSINAYLKAVESNQQNGLAHYYLGLSYLKAGEIEKAEPEAEKAQKLGVTFTALKEGLDKIKNGNNKTSTKDKAQ
mgnify:CR=1 FL=1